MDFLQILASIILFTTVATLVVAIAAYAAYKIRERNRPVKRASMALSSQDIQPVFLEPYTPNRSQAPRSNA